MAISRRDTAGNCSTAIRPSPFRPRTAASKAAAGNRAASSQRVAGGDGVEKADEANGRYISLQFDGELLVGATSIGLTEHVGALRGLIQGKIKLGAWKQKLLETPTRFAEAFIACQRPNS